MQSFKNLPRRTAFSVAFIGVAASLAGVGSAHAEPRMKTTTAAAAVAALKPVAAEHEAVRPLLKFQTVKWAGKPVQTLDEQSRILLVKAAAEKAGLQAVGLSFHDVYGVIEAETSWIPRTGSSKDGTPNLGLAQFEPRTAAGIGLKDPSDPVQAVFAAAKFMKDAAQWSTSKISHLKLKPAEYQAKLREGVSIYYNLSIKGRNKWDGLNTAQLPIETQRHIRNAAAGAGEALELARKLNA
jgi:hypothetical protein